MMSATPLESSLVTPVQSGRAHGAKWHLPNHLPNDALLHCVTISLTGILKVRPEVEAQL